MSKVSEKERKRLCFVIGPIGEAASETRKHADMLLHGVIKEVFRSENLDYDVRRADEETRPGMINDRIIQDIVNADIVIADLSELNPNAFYELGIRHATEKPTIHIAKAGTKLPFDNQGHAAIFIDVSNWYDIVAKREAVAAAIKQIEKPDYTVSNPITQSNASFKLKSSSDPKDRVIAQIQEEMASIQTALQSRLPTRTLRDNGDYVPYARASNFASIASNIFSETRNLEQVHSKITEAALANGIRVNSSEASDEFMRINTDKFTLELKVMSPPSILPRLISSEITRMQA